MLRVFLPWRIYHGTSVSRERADSLRLRVWPSNRYWHICGEARIQGSLNICQDSDATSRAAVCQEADVLLQKKGYYLL